MNEKARKKEITFGTVKNYYKSIKKVYDMNSLNLNWKLVSSGLLPSRKSAKDRAPTKEEIRRLVEYPDPRKSRAIVYIECVRRFLGCSVGLAASGNALCRNLVKKQVKLWQPR